jgi:hypothetical protein
VTAPGATSGIDVVLAQGGSIQGRVKNTSGSGIQNVGVEIHNLYGSLVKYASSVQTGADGSYKVMGLPSGSYKVFFIGNGGYISEWYNDKPDFAGADTVSVTAPNTTTHINAVLALGGSIAGRVTNAGDAGIENIYVLVATTDGYGVASTYTDENGYYTFGGLTTGSYKVVFSGTGGYIGEWYNDKPDFASADTIAVTAPVTTSGIDAVLALGGSFAGRVINAGGSGIANVFVELFTTNGNYVTSDSTDADGYYTIEGIQTGSYKVQFFGYNSGYISEWYNDKPDFDSADIITFPPGITSIETVLAPGGSISGTVTNTEGTGINGVEVEVFDLNGDLINVAYTNICGEYTVKGLPTGSYKVYFYRSYTGYIGEWYNDKKDLDSADEVAVTAPGTTTGIDAILELSYLTLTTPNGGESWNRNSKRTIRWNAAGCAGTLTLTLWQNGSLIGTIADGVDPADGSYSWTAGAYNGGTAPLGTGYTIRIQDNGSMLADESDAPFSIVKISVKTPNGGESWQKGSTQNITWVVKSISGSVRIVLLKNGVKVGNIVNSIDPALGTYSWTVGNYVGGTATAGTGYQVQVREIGTDAGDRSDGNFTLTGP